MAIYGRAAMRRILVAWLLLAMASPVFADNYRTWTDSTGRFKLRAKLLQHDANRVTLERDNGMKVTIEISRLSTEDRDFLSKMDEDNPFQAVESSPFQPVPTTAAPAVGNGPRIVQVDWSQSQAIALEATQSEWEVTPPAAAANFRARSTALPPKTDFFEKLSGVAINPLARKAVVAYSLGKGAQATTRIILCDLENGKTLATASESGEMAPLALHDNGQYILMRRNEFGFGNLDRLEIWSIRGGAVAKHLIWTPYEGEWGGGRDVMWAEFVSASTLATSSRSGKVALWQVASATPICHFHLTDGAVPTLSEDRRWIAFASDNKMGLFDVEKREVAVVTETPSKLTWPYVAFSPLGQKVACIAQDRILVWDVATGRLERDFTTAGLHIHGGIDYPSENFLLANNQFLIALDSQIKLWHYRGAEHIRTAGGNTLVAVSGRDKPGALAVMSLPHQEAVTLLQKALNQPDLFVFREGTKVKLDVSGIPADQRSRVSETLTNKLREMKCSVAPDGSIEVIAKIEGPQSRKVSYINSGDYQVQEYRSRLSFVYQGKPVWETSSTNIPGIISLREGENIEGVLRKASQGPSYGFYNNVVLPKFLQKPGDSPGPGGGQTLGVSQVTPEGLR